MLKLLVIAILVAFGLFILACLALACLMLLIIFTTPDDPKADVAAARRGTSEIMPVPDATLFSRLAREAMAYATRPGVSVIIDANGDFLLSTVSDVYGRRSYAESKRRVGKTLVAIICVFNDGGEVPEASASIEIPASQVDWSAHFGAISDIDANGPRMSYTDHTGRRREIRIPKVRRHHA